MHRIPIIQSLFDAARLSRQNGAEIQLASYYYSIYDNGLVKESKNIVTSLLDNPLYIACCTVHEYQEYGRQIDSQIFCYVNRGGEVSGKLTLSKWTLENIQLFANSFIKGATMRLLADPTQTFTFNDSEGMPIKSFQAVWALFSEIDTNCSTGKEAEFHFKYFVQKLDLDLANYSLEDYEKQLQESMDINKQYRGLLDRISALVV